ncbi:thiol-disulfide isomerase/thioredoxin [Virgibacillus halotolerans]|uniref:TlpA family protein disulfide reductase n=1 Tax=Virgibacillus halotolerans TaxID=1071053 RepID=UPI0019610269|nr:redoxin domain-containing protein [Virgibacillus halotolerans]MBM7598446.1 thiol-disulfide isomerase/thioredoxin [Virgibacillus halotolerans]
MSKRIIGIVVLVVLVGIVTFNIVQKNEDKQTDRGPDEYDVSGDPDVEGAMITSPGADDGIELGNMAPDFELETLSGETLKLSDLQGKKVILNFWATWCPPCKVEMPEMQEFYDEHGDDVEIVAVNLTSSETNEKKVHDYIDEHKYTYPVPLDKDSEVGDTYMAITVPTTYFIGTDGKVQQPKKVGPMTYEFMEEMLDELE